MLLIDKENVKIVKNDVKQTYVPNINDIESANNYETLLFNINDQLF